MQRSLSPHNNQLSLLIVLQCFVLIPAFRLNIRPFLEWVCEVWESLRPKYWSAANTRLQGGEGGARQLGCQAAAPGHNGVWELAPSPHLPSQPVATGADSPSAPPTHTHRAGKAPRFPGAWETGGARLARPGAAGERLGRRGRTAAFCPQVLRAVDHLPRHGLRPLGRSLAAAPAPRPHRGALPEPGAQIQAALQHGLPPARPLAGPRPRLLLRPAPPQAAGVVRPRARLPGAGARDGTRPGLLPRLLHPRPPAPRRAQRHPRTRQVLPGASGQRRVPQRAPAHHRAPELGRPGGARHPRPRRLHHALGPGPASHRKGLSPNLLHLRPQRGGQLLRGPEQDPRSRHLPRGEPRHLQASGPPVLDAAADGAPPRPQPEPRTRSLQCGPVPEGGRLELRDPALGLRGPDPGRSG